MEYLLNLIVSGIDRLTSGGPILIPIIFFSLWSHKIILERAYHLHRPRVIPSRFVTQSIYHELVRGNPDIAIKMCEKSPGPLSNVLRTGIRHRNADEETLKRVIRQAIRAEKPVLNEGLSTLAMLAPVAMFTGLLGTVLGMRGSFGALIDVQTKQLPTIADGISEALLTTAAGLIVALPSYVAYDYFRNKADRFLADLERHGMSLVRFLATGEYKLFQEEYGDIRELKRVED